MQKYCSRLFEHIEDIRSDVSDPIALRSDVTSHHYPERWVAAGKGSIPFVRLGHFLEEREMD